MTTITTVINPPLPTDTPAVFNTKAFDAWGDINTWAGQANTVAGEVSTNATTTTTQAGIATTQAGIATTQAGEALASASNAAQSASDAESLVSKFQGELASDPALNKTGGPLTAGDWYINTVSGLIRAYTGSAFVNGLSTVAGVSSVNGLSGDLIGFLQSSGASMTGALNEAPAVSAASATTVDIGALNSNTVTITGTTGIASFGTATAGVIRRLVFDDVLILTHNGTSLILPGATNITTAVGDVAEFLSLGTGNWRCIAYQKSSGQALVSSNTTFLNRLVTQSSTTLIIPNGTFKVRGYAGGKGGNGSGGAAPAGAGSGGGFASGDIAVTPGETLTIDITAGVAKVLRGATALLTANPGNNGSTATDVAGGTAAIDASVTNGGAYSGGVGRRSATTWPGGGSAGSPLGNGYAGGALSPYGGGGGIGGVGYGEFGGGVGGAAGNYGPGGAGGPASSVGTSYGPGPGRVIPFADPLLAHCTSAAEFITASEQFTSVAGPGAGGLPGGTQIGPGGTGGFGGGGGSYNGANVGQGGTGGELGGGGAGKTTGGTSLACGGGGAGGVTGGAGGPATVWIFY